MGRRQAPFARDQCSLADRSQHPRRGGPGARVLRYPDADSAKARCRRRCSIGHSDSPRSRGPRHPSPTRACSQGDGALPSGAPRQVQGSEAVRRSTRQRSPNRVARSTGRHGRRPDESVRQLIAHILSRNAAPKFTDAVIKLSKIRSSKSDRARRLRGSARSRTPRPAARARGADKADKDNRQKFSRPSRRHRGEGSFIALGSVSRDKAETTCTE